MNNSLKTASAVLLSLLLTGGSVLGFADNDTNAEQKVMTIDDAVAYTMENNRDIQIADFNIDKEALNKKESDKAYRDADNSSSSRYSTLSGKLVQKGYYKLLADLSYDLSIMQRDAVELGATIETKSGFYTILNKIQDVETRTVNLERAQKVYDIASRKLEMGLGTKQELLMADANLETAKLDLESAKDDLTFERMSFNKTLGLPLEDDVKLDGAIGFEIYPEVDLEEKETEALENRIDVIAADQAYEASKLKEEIYGYFYTPNVYDFKAVEYEERSAYNELIDTEQEARLAVKKAYIDMKKAERAVFTLEKNVASMREVYRLSELTYEVGMSTQTELLQAQVDLETVELAYNQALLGYELAKMSFEASYQIGM
ncbi:MAG TPA: TolC family protein [Clostridia bacterium]|nr:TolC family protein [Clostridia bacterium]